MRAFHRIVPSLSLFPLSLSLAIPQAGLLSHVTSLTLPSGHSGLVLTLSNAALSSPCSPHSLVEDVSVWATSLLGVALIRARNLQGLFTYLFIFPLVMLPSEIPKLPTDTPGRGFPGVWKLLFCDSLPGMGLHP